MKNLTTTLLLILTCGQLMAQEPTPLKDEPGTWKYTYLNDGNTAQYTKQLGMTTAESALLKTKVDQLVELLHRNPVLTNPRGFNASVEARPFYPYDLKKLPERYGYIAEINFRFPMWFESKGRKYTQNIEPPRTTIYINHISILKNSTFSVPSLSGSYTANAAKNGPGRTPSEVLKDICKPMKIRELAPGVILYDYAIVITKPGRALFLPLTVDEAYHRLIAYYEAATAEDPYNEMLLNGIREEYASVTPKYREAPAYFGGMFSGVTPDENDDPLMLFNNDFFDRTLPKTAIQAIVIPIDSDYFREDSDFAPNSVGFLRINQLLHSLDVEELAKMIE